MPIVRLLIHLRPRGIHLRLHAVLASKPFVGEALECLFADQILSPPRAFPGVPAFANDGEAAAIRAAAEFVHAVRLYACSVNTIDLPTNTSSTSTPCGPFRCFAIRSCTGGCSVTAPS